VTSFQDALDHARQKAREGICVVCDEPIAYHDPATITGEEFVDAIKDAVDHANAHPTNNARDGDLAYVVEQGYYPGDHAHYVDLSDVDDTLRQSASIDIMTHLAQRGLAVNAVRWTPPSLHVVSHEQVAFDYYDREKRLAGGEHA